MSNDADTAPAAPAIAGPPVATGPVPILQFLRDNFAVVSGLAVVSGIALAVIFLFSYLTVFDWHLIWFVQYSGVITFGLVAIGLIGGSFMFLNSLIQSWLNASSLDPKSRRRWLIGLACATLILLGLEIWSATRHNEGYFHIVNGALVIGVGAWLVIICLGYIRAGIWPNASQAAAFMILVVITTIGFGQWLGYAVLENTEFDQNVYVKDTTFNDTKLVIVMSRFTVLPKDRLLYVVPTSNISKFQTAHELITILPAP